MFKNLLKKIKFTKKAIPANVILVPKFKKRSAEKYKIKA